MSGNLTAAAQARYNDIAAFSDKVQRVYGLVETLAAARTNADQLTMPLCRAFSQLKMQFMGIGLDRLAQLCGSMELATRRGSTSASKLRILREGVGTLKFQLELELRSIVSDDQAAQRRLRELEGKQAESSGTGH